MTRHLKESGMSNREITKEFGISRNTVSKMLRKTGIRAKRKGNMRSKLDPYEEQIKVFIDEYVYRTLEKFLMAKEFQPANRCVPIHKSPKATSHCPLGRGC